MDKNNLIELKKPELVEDVLTKELRNGARRLLKEALEVEIEAFIEEYQDLRLSIVKPVSHIHITFAIPICEGTMILPHFNYFMTL